MKVLQHILALSALGLASPLPPSQDLSTDGLRLLSVEHINADIQSVNDADAVLQTLEKRLNRGTCRAIGRTLIKIGTSAAVVATINGATEIADQVCVDNNNPTCSNYVKYVRRAMNILFLLAGSLHGSVGVGSHGDDESIVNGAVRRSVESNSTVSIQDILTLGGYKFDFVESIVVPETLGKRGDERSANHQTVVRGLVDEEGGAPTDIAINDFGNGEFDLQYADSDTSSVAGENSTDIHKRYDGSGIKVPFTTRKRSKLTRAHQKQVSAEIARSWANFATTASYHMNDFFGLVKTGHEANFYFRIIPELKGFGLNYESVNACGGMAKYL